MGRGRFECGGICLGGPTALPNDGCVVNRHLVVDSVDGNVTVESECGKWSIFTITRPMHHVAPPCEVYDDRLEDAPDERMIGLGAA